MRNLQIFYSELHCVYTYYSKFFSENVYKIKEVFIFKYH